MDYRKKIINHLENNNGMITTLYCREEEIPTIYLTRLVSEDVITRIERGIYISKNGDFDEFYFLQYKYKKIVFSYESALFLQGLTDKIPQVIEITIPNSYKINKMPSNVKPYYVNDDLSDVGVIEVKTIFGNKVKSYNLERVVCDFIKNKNNVDPEVYIKTLKLLSKSMNFDLNKLFSYAKKLKIADKVRTIIEVVYE